MNRTYALVTDPFYQITKILTSFTVRVDTRLMFVSGSVLDKRAAIRAARDGRSIRRRRRLHHFCPSSASFRGRNARQNHRCVIIAWHRFSFPFFFQILFILSAITYTTTSNVVKHTLTPEWEIKPATSSRLDSFNRQLLNWEFRCWTERALKPKPKNDLAREKHFIKQNRKSCFDQICSKNGSFFRSTEIHSRIDLYSIPFFCWL